MTTIKCHYFVNTGFFETDDWIIDNADKIADLPCTIVQGRSDTVCAPEIAWRLHKALPKSTIQFIIGAAHSSSEPGTRSALINATDEMR